MRWSRYYGLDGARPSTLAELRAAFGLQHRHVQRMVREGTRQLIDPHAAGAVSTPHEERVRHRAAVQARLAALPDVLAGLAEVERQIVMRFHALDGGPPGRQRAIARSADWGATGDASRHRIMDLSDDD